VCVYVCMFQNRGNLDSILLVNISRHDISRNRSWLNPNPWSKLENSVERYIRFQSKWLVPLLARKRRTKLGHGSILHGDLRDTRFHPYTVQMRHDAICFPHSGGNRQNSGKRVLTAMFMEHSKILCEFYG